MKTALQCQAEEELQAVERQIRGEVEKQDARWGFPQKQTNAGWLCILAEEFGEVAKEVTEVNAAISKNGFLPADMESKLYNELQQTAAVCVQYMRHIRMGLLVKYSGIAEKLEIN